MVGVFTDHHITHICGAVKTPTTGKGNMRILGRCPHDNFNPVNVGFQYFHWFEVD